MKIENYFPLVRRIVRQYSAPSISQEDLFQEGCIGLIEANNHFKPELNVPFEAYATTWIRKYINEAFRRYGYIVALPQHGPINKIYTEQLDQIVAVEDDETLSFEDVLKSNELQPDEQMIFNEGLQAWDNIKKQQKFHKKGIDVGDFYKKYVNK